MPDVAAGRIGSIACNLCRGQSQRVSDRDMRAEGNGNRMIGHYAVEIMPVGKTLVFNAEVLHRTAMGDDPRALRGAGGGVGEALQNISDGVHIDVKIAAIDQLLFSCALL
jgi:hypothetical protein